VWLHADAAVHARNADGHVKTATMIAEYLLMPVPLPVWVVFGEHVAHSIVLFHKQVVQQLDATPQVQVETNQLNP
jgi:hypothetical protein